MSAPNSTKQKAATIGQQCNVVKREPFAAQEIDQQTIEPLKPDRLVTQNFGHGVCRDERIGKAKHHKLAVLRALYQPHRRLQHGDARGLGANQCPGHMEAVLWQQLVKVVAGDATRDVRKMLAHQGCGGIANTLQTAINRTRSAAFRDGRFQCVLAHRTQRHARAVVQQHIERFDIVDGLSAHQRVHAAGVVADHAADGAAVVRRGVGSEGELAAFGFGTQRVQHNAGLDARTTAFVVHRYDAAHVL